MNPNPVLGVILHAIGGLAAGSFYIPYKGVRRWAWESYWLVGGFFSWIIAPWVAALLLIPELGNVFRTAPVSSLVWTYVFGVLWGIGGLTFGLSMRYLGLSLGYALALGFCAAFGTIIPPVFFGTFPELLSTVSGAVTLFGVFVCLGGIAVSGRAGVLKEKEMSDSAKRESIEEFSFAKGLWIAIFAGVMSACMAFAMAAGKPIAACAVDHGAADLWKNMPVLIVALLGGFTTNFVWCLYLNLKNGTFLDYTSGGKHALPNYVLSATAGVIWYLQFFFYSMGTTKMGKYDFSSWTIHMAFIIVFSTMWGLFFREWRGASPRARGLVFTGIAVLVLSTIVIGAGNYLESAAK
ncbi:MAG: L-rhamnose/proton symporter RhaT [Candidatus Hydrogenedentes bacterium]|nr:L-rhamnose/proton symporter RhaT [Candidatus Hydrogenedentota bacterium]